MEEKIIMLLTYPSFSTGNKMRTSDDLLKEYFRKSEKGISSSGRFLKP
jgi:hypothetical protein